MNSTPQDGDRIRVGPWEVDFIETPDGRRLACFWVDGRMVILGEPGT
jgi:hypothetical protein